MRKLRFFRDRIKPGEENLLSNFNFPVKKAEPEAIGEPTEELSEEPPSETPSMSWPKTDIQFYLDERNIEYKPNATKATLLELCKLS